MSVKNQKYTSIRNNRQAIENEAVKCVCIDCLAYVDPQDITTWTDNGQTAVCPTCECSKIIGFDSHIFVLNNIFVKRYIDYIFGK